MKFYISVLFFALLVSFHTFAEDGVSYKVLKIADRVFYNTNKPVIKVQVSNYGEESKRGTLLCRVETDSNGHVYDFEQKFSIAPADSTLLSFKFGLDEGFYKISIFADGVLEKQVCMAYEPELVESDFDRGFDHEAYYGKACSELSKTPVYALVEKIKKTGSKYRDAYSVKIKSAGGAYIDGYYIAPKKKSALYPVVITCMDSNEALEFSSIDENRDRVDFIVLPRKGLIRNEKYYINSYADMIRAIDFVYVRKEADLKNIYVQGTGTGGARALATAALDKRVAAVSVYAPGYSYENVLGKSMPYEVKNLSGYIECPVIMGVGLEDKVIAPADNFKIYNPIKSNKEYYIFIEGHNPPLQWKEITDNFYKKHKR